MSQLTPQQKTQSVIDAMRTEPYRQHVVAFMDVSHLMWDDDPQYIEIRDELADISPTTPDGVSWYDGDLDLKRLDFALYEFDPY